MKELSVNKWLNMELYSVQEESQDPFDVQAWSMTWYFDG